MQLVDFMQGRVSFHKKFNAPIILIINNFITVEFTYIFNNIVAYTGKCTGKFTTVHTVICAG